jgi:uncharacterized protein
MEHPESAPEIRELDREAIDVILARNHVGRIGYARGNQIDIRPIHYVYSDGWIYGRTAFGSKYETLGDNAFHWWPVVFEVDEVEDLFRWRSILAHGGFHVIERTGTESELETWLKAVGLLRTLVPATLRSDDPVPSRTVLFRISIQEATGREASAPDRV